MNTKSCLIILSYVESCSEEFIRPLAESSEYIIAADGGQYICRKYGIVPNLVLGDFDSSNPSDHELFDCEYITYPCEKDLTDANASVLEALNRGYSNITLLGGIGGRLDHTLGNIGILCAFYDKVDQIRYIDQSNSMCLLVDNELTLKKDIYKYFAIFSLDDYSYGVTIRGGKYTLNDYTLPRATSIGISNEILGDEAIISVKKGTLLVMCSSDRMD